LIADEMGLGKSIESIGIAMERERRGECAGCLVICPASVKYNWLAEIEKFTHKKATVIEGPADERYEL